METFPVPEDALREAVLNAITHKDYASGTPIQISVYDDKIMLWNPGQLPPEWTVERLAERSWQIATQNNETSICHDRFPLPSPLPQCVVVADLSALQPRPTPCGCAGEGDKVSRCEFYV